MTRKILVSVIAGIAITIGGFFGYFIVNATEFVYGNVKTVDDEIVAVPVKKSIKKNALEKVVETIKIEEKKEGYVLEHEKAVFPEITGEAFLVADLESGQIIASNNSSVQYPIASITKLMTALIARDILDDNETTVATERAIETFSESGDITQGSQYSIGTLMYPLLLQSSNDAAEVISEHWDRSFFIDQMNKRAESIDLFNTNYSDPSGISSFNVSTAEDLFKLTQYIRKEDPGIFEITKLSQHSVDGQTWYNNSLFKNDDNYLGGKNGETSQAKKTIITMFDMPLEIDGGSRKIAIIVLRSKNLEADVRKISRFINKHIYFYE